MSETHARTVAYARDTMIPEQEPPRTQSGAILYLSDEARKAMEPVSKR